MARESNVNVKSERNPSSRDPEKRVQPFASVLLTGLVVVPLFGVLLRFIAFCAPSSTWIVGGLDLVLFGLLGPAVAMGIGYKVTKRIPFVIWHVALTMLAFALAEYTTVSVGWPADAAPWYVQLKAVVWWPAWWVILHLFGSLFVSLSWLLYRIDAFRAATGSDEGKDGSGLAALVKWPKGARIRAETIESDEFAITAEVDHEGIPISQLRSSAEAIEENPAFIRGRSSVVGGEKGGTSTMRFVHTDPRSVWREWSGLTHPGGLYHEPISTSYYSTGAKQWYSFVRTPDGYRSQLAPNFASPNGTFKGSQGMTSSGKSGDAAIELAEVFSRRDVQVIYVDTAKLLQNASWCLDFVSLAAANRRASGELFAAIRRLGEYRGRVLGEAGIRDFSHEATKQTGMSWVHIFADEFDVAKQGADMTWLATKGRSLGFRFSFTLPRAHGGALDTDIRGAVGMWCQFGINQDYDKGFALSDETIAAGAKPEQFGTSVPGAHYLDGAPGVDSRLYALDCRSYKTKEDYSDLRAAVIAARAAFTPMTWTPGELEALGPVAESCNPANVRAGHLGQDDAPVPATAPAPTPKAYDPVNQEGNDMEATRDLNDLKLDPETRAMLDDLPSTDVSDLEAEYGNLDPRQPLPETTPDTFTLPETKPRVSAAETIAEFEAALIRMARRNVKEFGNADLRDEMRVAMRPSAMSERFTALQNDATLNPPGLTVERLDGHRRGRFLLVRVAGTH
jgi:hypothetical protein